MYSKSRREKGKILFVCIDIIIQQHRRRQRQRRRCRLSFDTVVIYFHLIRSFCENVWIEIWIENCYHKHIWLGLFLYARTQFAVNSTTENIINHFGTFSTFFSRIQCFSLAFFSCFAVFYSISFQSSFCQLVNLWCKRFLFIFFSIAFCRCDCRIGRE